MYTIGSFGISTVARLDKVLLGSLVQMWPAKWCHHPRPEMQSAWFQRLADRRSATTSERFFRIAFIANGDYFLFPSMHQATDEAYQPASMGFYAYLDVWKQRRVWQPLMELLHPSLNLFTKMGMCQYIWGHLNHLKHLSIKYVIFKSTVPREEKITWP